VCNLQAKPTPEVFSVASPRPIPILTAVNTGTASLEWVWPDTDPPLWRIETSPTGIDEFEFWLVCDGDSREWTDIAAGSAFWRVIGVELDETTPATPHSNVVERI